MRMRKIPIRGETYILEATGDVVTVVEIATKDYVKVILPNGRISAVDKSHLNLPTIDTKNYEKLIEARAAVH